MQRTGPKTPGDNRPALLLTRRGDYYWPLPWGNIRTLWAWLESGRSHPLSGAGHRPLALLSRRRSRAPPRGTACWRPPGRSEAIFGKIMEIGGGRGLA